ncbi:AraC family transcriptional regulator [Listeria welshimeri]|nr:AraC family transcriptional regulator [Listeria welshimeri]
MNDLLKIINRIELNLDDEITYIQLCKNLNISVSTLQRIFPALFNITLSDYIRKRRLTKAAFELKQTHSSVLEVAIKYGYESADAFTSAFKKQHYATPTAIRNGAPINVFNPIRLNSLYEGGDFLQIEVKKIPSFYIAGISIETTVNSDEIGLLWQKLLESNLVDDLLLSSKTGNSFGVCYDIRDNGCIKYMAGWQVDNPDVVKHLPVETILIETTTFAVIPCVGQVPESLHKAWQYVWGTFLPESGYNYTGFFDLEYYPEKVTDSNDNRVQILVPIEK